MTGMTEKRDKSSWLQRREAAGLSIRDLATRSGVNRGTISRIERGWPATAVEAQKLLIALEDAEASKGDA